MRTGSDVARGRGREADKGADGGLVIERVTSRDAADRWRQIAQECFEADYYEMPADPAAEVYERIESTRSDDRYELWLGCVRDDADPSSRASGTAGGPGTSNRAGTTSRGSGTPVVLGQLRLPVLDNVDNAVVNICTRPAFRQRGHGTAMLQHLTERARTHGRTRLIGEVGEPMTPGEVEPSAHGALGAPMTSGDVSGADAVTPPGVLFATRAGARPVTSEVRRLLRTSELDDHRLSQLKGDAMAHSADYSMIQWDGPAPADILDDLATLHSRMTIDAPLEELDWEPELWTPERYREREQRVIASGQVCMSTAARHDPSGQTVALTDIGFVAADPYIAYQWATIVLPSHRGHRLGMRVKLANLEFLRRSRPRIRMLNTWNAAINDHMVAINEAIGFRPVERWREWQLELSGHSS
jgi:GNAT superfamily N-acetyltransferase